MAGFFLVSSRHLKTPRQIRGGEWCEVSSEVSCGCAATVGFGLRTAGLGVAGQVPVWSCMFPLVAVRGAYGEGAGWGGRGGRGWWRSPPTPLPGLGEGSRGANLDFGLRILDWWRSPPTCSRQAERRKGNEERAGGQCGAKRGCCSRGLPELGGSPQATHEGVTRLALGVGMLGAGSAKSVLEGSFGVVLPEIRLAQRLPPVVEVTVVVLRVVRR